MGKTVFDLVKGKRVCFSFSSFLPLKTITDNISPGQRDQKLLKTFVCVHFRVIIKISEALRQVKSDISKWKFGLGGPMYNNLA